MNPVRRFCIIAGLLVLMVPVVCLGQGQWLDKAKGKFSKALDKPVRCGRITRITVTRVPVSILNLDQLLLAGKLNPDDPYQQALTSRVPKPGNAFVFITFEIEPGKSLGRYDYVLTIGKQETPIEALAPSGEPFDPRVWQIPAESVVEEVEAFFEIELPPRPTTAYLRPRLKTTIPEEVVELPLGSQDLPTAELPPASPEAKQAPEVKPEAEPEANDKPAPEKEPEPEPEPEVKPPAKEKPAAKKPAGTNRKKNGKKDNGKSDADALEDIW